MFIVNLKRLGRKEDYDLSFEKNYELIANIKKLPYDLRSYDPQTHIWTVNAKGLSHLFSMYKGRKDIQFKFEDDKQREQFINIIKKHKNANSKKEEAQAALEKHNEFILDLKSKLPEMVENFDYTPFLKEGIVPMPHQVAAAIFCNNVNSSLLAMDLGTGKSLASILACQINPVIKKVLFICPANLKLNLQNEVEKFTNEKCFVIKTTKDKKTGGYRLVKYKRNKGYSMDECKFLVLNYDYFNKSEFDPRVRIEGIGLTNIDTIVFDEAHTIANKSSNTSRNIKNAFEKLVKRRILLTATPVKNKLTQVFPLLKMVKPEEFSNESEFFKEYCGLKFQKNEWDRVEWVPDENNPPRLEALFNKMQTFTYRVLKKDVLKDLPDITITQILLEMTDQEAKDYKEIEDGFLKVDWSKDFVAKLDDDDSTSPIVIISRLRQFTAGLKVRKTLELTQELNDMGEKVIIFDCFKKPLYALSNMLGAGSELYTGDQSMEEKQDLVDKFQDVDSDLKNLLISLRAGNAGITLTASANVIQITESYVPSENSQAYGRSHRKGQNRGVNVYKLLISDTIDEAISVMVLEKEQMISQVVDGVEFNNQIEESVLGDILKSLKNKYSTKN